MRHTIKNLQPLPDDSRMISTFEAPTYLGVTRTTLGKWRHEGVGPPYVTMKRRIWYRAIDLRRWLEANTYTKTSQYTQQGVRQ